jgi:hypothetical protein
MWVSYKEKGGQRKIEKIGEALKRALSRKTLKRATVTEDL